MKETLGSVIDIKFIKTIAIDIGISTYSLFWTHRQHMTANLRRLSLAQVSFSHHDSRLPSNSYSASLSQTMHCKVKTKTRCNPCWWLPSTISPPSTLLSTSSPLPSRLSTSRKGSLPNFQNKSLFSKLFVRFGFFRFIGVVSLAVLGTSVTYILLGRQQSTLYKQMTFFAPLLNLFIKDYILFCQQISLFEICLPG